MCARHVQDGVHTRHRKLRGHARELQRRFQEEAAHRTSLLVVIGRHSARNREADGTMHAALIFDLGGEDVAVCGRTILAVKSLERQGESIVPLDLGIEVDLARKDLRERHGQVGALARRTHRREQRR
jgi:hypothetical protein